MPIIEIRKSNLNLWNEYPDLDIISEFKKLRKKEGDEKSSNILKAIYYIWDPKSDKRDSGFTEQELIAEINENLIGEKEFDWEKYEDIKQAWFKYCLTKTDTLLKKYEEEIEGLQKMLDEWKWDKKTATDKKNAMAALRDLYQDYATVKSLFISERFERLEMEGGYTPSLLEEMQGV